MLKEIIEEHCFVEQLDELQKKYSRVYDAKDSMSWVLARSPKHGEPLDGFSDHMVAKTRMVGGTPSFRFLYKFDYENDHVHMIAIAAVEDGED